MLLNAATGAASHVKQLAAYMQDIKERKPYVATKFQAYFYAYDSSDNTVSILTDTLRGLKEQGVEFSHSDIITDLFCIPQTRELMMKEIAWAKKDWAGADNSPCPLKGVRNCMLAYFRERLRRYILEEIVTTAPVKDLSRAAFIYFDGDVHQLPSINSMFTSIEKVTEKHKHPAGGELQRGVGAIFSNGREHNGPSESWYYDSFASVDKDGVFEVPSDRAPIARGVKWLRQQSGFGGLAVYNGLAYFDPVCSYSQHVNSGNITAYIKTDEYAEIDEVAGFPCEHTNLHLCIEHSGFTNFIYTNLKTYRTSWEWNKQYYGQLTGRTGWEVQFTNGREYIHDFILDVEGKGGALIPNNILFTNSYNPLSLPSWNLTDAQKVLRQTMLHTISTLPGHRVLFYDDQVCEKALKKFDSMFKAPHKLPAWTGAKLAKYFTEEKQGMLKGDMCRLIQLFEHGGLYFDIDVLPVVDLRKHIRTDATLVTIRSTNEVQGNDGLFQAFIGATPRHPAIGLALLKTLEYYEAKNANNRRKMESLTLWAKHNNIGGNLLARAVCEFAKISEGQMRKCLNTAAFAPHQDEVSGRPECRHQDPKCIHLWFGDVWLHVLNDTAGASGIPGGYAGPYSEAIARRFNNGVLNCTIGSVACQHTTQIFMESSLANTEQENVKTWGYDDEGLVVGRQGHLGPESAIPQCSYVAIDRHYEAILMYSRTYSADWKQFCLVAWAKLPASSLPVLRGSDIPKIIHIVGEWTKFTYEWWAAANPGYAVQRWTPPEIRFYTGTHMLYANQHVSSLIEYLPDCNIDALKTLTDDDIMRIFSIIILHKYGGILTTPKGDLQSNHPVFDPATSRDFSKLKQKSGKFHPVSMYTVKQVGQHSKFDEVLKKRCDNCPSVPGWVSSFDSWAQSVWTNPVSLVDGATCFGKKLSPEDLSSSKFVAVAAPAHHPALANATNTLAKSNCTTLPATAFQLMSDLLRHICGSST